VTLVLLAWTLHDVNPAAVLARLRDADPWLLAATVLVATTTFPLRTVRWRLILRSVDGHEFRWGPLWHATAIGFMGNNLLPARAGELARAYVAKRATGVRFTTAVASLAVERVFDGLTLVGLMTVALAVARFPENATIGGARLTALASGAAVLCVVALSAAILLAYRPERSIVLLGGVCSRLLPERAARPLTSWLEGLIAGLSVLMHPGRFAAVALWSLVLWLVNASSFVICYHAFALELPAISSLLLQGVIAIGVAIPASPGFFGPFEAATRLTLALYGVGAEQAVGYAVGYHLATFIPITALGLYSLTRAHVRLADLRRPQAAEG
jgi:uncharacterized protein (TIRG00374 family)